MDETDFCLSYPSLLTLSLNSARFCYVGFNWSTSKDWPFKYLISLNNPVSILKSWKISQGPHDLSCPYFLGKDSLPSNFSKVFSKFSGDQRWFHLLCESDTRFAPKVCKALPRSLFRTGKSICPKIVSSFLRLPRVNLRTKSASSWANPIFKIDGFLRRLRSMLYRIGILDI